MLSGKTDFEFLNFLFYEKKIGHLLNLFIQMTINKDSSDLKKHRIIVFHNKIYE